MNLRPLVIGVFLLAGARPGVAQGPPEFDPGRVELTREDLHRLLEQYEAALQSTAYSSVSMNRIRADAERIRGRLRDGDFRVGDGVVLFVQGEAELPDSLSVEPGPQITLPLFGSISLAGVLRSEIEEHLTVELARFIREPVVRAEALMRVSVQGAVGTPGFYLAPARMLVTEALMLAGGPATDANLQQLRIDRGTEAIIDGEELQLALQQGRTLDQLNMRAGDQIFLPPRSTSSFLRGFGRWALVLGTALVFGVRSF